MQKEFIAISGVKAAASATMLQARAQLKVGIIDAGQPKNCFVEYSYDFLDLNGKTIAHSSYYHGHKLRNRPIGIIAIREMSAYQATILQIRKAQPISHKGFYTRRSPHHGCWRMDPLFLERTHS